MKTKTKKNKKVKVDGKEFLLQMGKYSIIYYIVAFTGFAIGYLVVKSFVLWILK